MATLSVNIDHVATVRQARRTSAPDPVTAALIAELAGADGITAHLREDRRHIQDRDVTLLKQVVKTKLNLEMAATGEMLNIALDLKPDMVTLVPEKRQELTTEGGLDLKTNAEYLKNFILSLKQGGISVNLFADPSPDNMKICHKIDADGVEIHTGAYADAPGRGKTAELKRIADSAAVAKRLGLKVHAGHGLDYQNITEVAAIREIEEFAIGFSIIARSVFSGMEEAVREMKRLVLGHGIRR